MFWIVIVFFIMYIIMTIRKKQSLWKHKGIKYAEPKFFLGNFDLIRRSSFPESFQKMYNAFPEERYYGGYQFLKPVLMIKDPDLIKQITVKYFDHFVDHQTVVTKEVDPFWGKNLGALQGDQWRDLRATLSPSFTGSKMRFMYGLMEECVENFIDYFKEKCSDTMELEMKDTFSRFTNDVIASTAFGLKCDSLRERKNEFYIMGKEASNMGVWRIMKFFTYGISPTLYKLLQVKIIPTNVSNYFSKIIENTINIRKEQNIIRPDMIHLLMESQKNRENQEGKDPINDSFSATPESDIQKNRQKYKLTVEDITSSAFIFFLAGFDTVSNVIAFVFYELAVNPDVQDRLREEINSISAKITYDKLLGLKYLDMVVSETLRKWPPAILTDRQVTKDFTIQPERPGEKPLLLEKGTVCGLPIYAIQNDPKFFPNPEKFDPERFSDENKHNIAPFTFIPFGAGPRNCIGNRFGLLETKLIIVHLLKNFEFVPVKRTNIPMVLDKNRFTPTSKGGMWLGLKKLIESN